jgi:cold shock CspA family protein
MQQLRQTGTVVRYFANRGYGFIRCEGQPDLFFHQRSLRDTAL